MVTPAELKQKTPVELEESLSQLRVKLGKMRFDLEQNNLNNSSEISITRRAIARILTELRKRQEK
ncbi:MAG: 50S ribosomal protein L29 [Parcubacteria group bacterium GW2011_GWB1_48_6]|nr:MAG: 50S ribosomal protein L29 [Parcubacteria group bacterium GW2011_GWB1_48_6]